jgi:hypothetical protein
MQMAKAIHTDKSGNLSQGGVNEPALEDGKKLDRFDESTLTQLEWRRLTEGAWPDGKELTDLELWERYKKKNNIRPDLGLPQQETEPPSHGVPQEYRDTLKEIITSNIADKEDSPYLEEMVSFGPEAFEEAAVVLDKFGETFRRTQLQNKSNARLYELGREHANILTIMTRNHPTPMTEMYFQGFDDRIDEILANSKQETRSPEEMDALRDRDIKRGLGTHLEDMLNEIETIEKETEAIDDLAKDAKIFYTQEQIDEMLNEAEAIEGEEDREDRFRAA